MDTEAFRRSGHALVDWIADYRAGVESRPVLAQVSPGAIRAALPPAPPAQGEDFAALLADVERILLPGITHWQSPNFFAYFPANASGPSVLGEFLAAALGVQGMLWATSPACTELETHVLDWLAQMLALPPGFDSGSAGGAVLQDSASSAVLCALLAARERLTQGRSNHEGVAAAPLLTVYASEQAHSSVEKAVRIAGLGSRQLRRIATDASFALRPDALAGQIEADLASGARPAFVVATLGTTSSLAFDPLPSIGHICRQYGVWLHVDAAMSGTAAICEEFRTWFAGLAFADSLCFDPHKWMFTNFDCSCLFLRDRQALIQALGVFPEYLRNPMPQTREVIDYRDWQIPLGRRFRALKLWFVIRHFGVQGLQARIRRHVALAQEFAGWVRADAAFELAAPVPLNLICFRHRGGDQVNQSILKRVNRSGELYLSHTRLRASPEEDRERFTLRLCVGQTDTERRHLVHAWQHIREAAAAVEEEMA